MSEEFAGLVLEETKPIEKTSKKKTKTEDTAPVEVSAAKQEKLKALEAMRFNCDKEFGKNTVMRMDGANIQRLPCISTGVMGIDLILGGGFAKGRIAEVAGMESSGKCLTSDTQILTPQGYKTIEQIFIENGVVPSCSNKTVEKKIPLINRYGDVENTIAITCNNRKLVKKITTRTGRVIKGTYNHPLLVFSNSGNFIWKTIKEITSEDYLISPRQTSFFGTNDITEREAYCLGLIIADGYLSNNRIGITNDDEDIKAIIENEFSTLFNFENPKKYSNNGKDSIDYHFNSKEAVFSFYKKYGLSSGVAKDKIVPQCIKQGSKQNLIAFIKGYMDCESYVSTKQGLEVSSASYTLLYDMKLLLETLGIVSFLREKIVKGYEENEYFTLTIAGKDLIIYNTLIGTNSNKMKTRLQEYCSCRESKTKGYTNHDSIPYLNNILRDFYFSLDVDCRNRETLSFFSDIFYEPSLNVTYDYLKDIVESFNSEHYLFVYLQKLFSKNYYFDKVVETIDFGEVPTFDFAMEKTHSFIAEGIISHNTTLCLQTMIQCQKEGGVVGFIDAEHALDVEYAKGLGLNIDELFLTQPSNGEQALEVAEQMIDAGIDMLVIDSVAALTPQSEIEGDMGDAQMGKHARLIGQACRKLTAKIGKNKTVVIFTNQYRSGIGPYSSSRVATGGNSLKFFASQRVDMGKGEVSEDEGEAISNLVKIKVIKNKVAPPFRKGVFEIIFGKGFNRASDLLSLAVSFDIIKKAGSWYSYGEEKIGQGSTNAGTWLTETEERYNEIEQKVKDRILAKK